MPKKILPTLNLETKLWRQGFLVIGIDEVGRGALSGPVYVGGVCIKPAFKCREIDKIIGLMINDSKQLTPKQREKLAPAIKNIELARATASVSTAMINRVGIVRAVRLAAIRVIRSIEKQVGECHLLTDAGINLRYGRGIIHGDCLSISIAAASIIAKVERDRLMVKISKKFPHYQWQKNKGYGTQEHIAAIKKHGKTKFHRELYLRKIITDKKY